MQDISKPGPSEHREPLVEVVSPSPCQVEAHEENTSDSVGRSSQQAAPHSLLEHSDLETDASALLTMKETEAGKG
jgi:hypothetical protein